MDETSQARRLALFNGAMAYGFSLLSVRLLQKLAGSQGLPDDLEAIAAEITRGMRNVVPTGFTIEEEADAIGQADREFNKTIAKVIADLKS
ncbi:MAG: hypothetical protein JWR08_494 [Enterovirga sp.]|nr:hypothetical protein [Enterovirga sp.]